MIEKREYFRIPMTGWVEVREKGKSKTQYGYVNNISMNGVSLFGSKAFSPGTALTLSFHFFGHRSFQSVTDVEGFVVWSCKKGPLSAFGIVFQELVAPGKYPGLFEFLREVSRPCKMEIPQMGLTKKEEHYA